jgi:cell division protein ZapA
MAQVNVGIGGRSYRLACNPGEEAHLEQLALTLDRKIQEMRQTFGEIGDQRLAIMAALTIADDAAEAQRRAAAEAARADAAEEEARTARRDARELENALTKTVEEMAARIDAFAFALGGVKHP